MSQSSLYVFPAFLLESKDCGQQIRYLELQKTVTRVTKKITNSKLIVRLTGRFGINSGYRSQIALYDAYTAGVANQAGGAGNIGYYHYGIYNATGGDLWTPGAYEYTITGISANTAKTYYWFGGSISGGTQKYAGLTMTITEIAT